MIVAYEWQGLWNEVPAPGTWMECSGDPDKPTVRGVVIKVDRHDGERNPDLFIELPNDQVGLRDFLEWVIKENDLGAHVSDNQEARWVKAV